MSEVECTCALCIFERDRPPDEDNDCSVYALALACGVPYPIAHQWLAERGRKFGKGFPVGSIVYSASEKREEFLAGCRALKIQPPEKTIRAFIKAHAKGRFLLFVTNHVLAVVNGKVYDSANKRLRTKIKHVYYVFTPEEWKVASFEIHDESGSRPLTPEEFLNLT